MLSQRALHFSHWTPRFHLSAWTSSKCVRQRLHKKNTSVTRDYSNGSSCSNAKAAPPFPVISDPLDPSCLQLEAAAKVTEEKLAKLDMITHLCKQGGGAKATESYLKRKVLPRQRMDRLWDEGLVEMFEIGGLAGLSMPYGDIPGAGIVTGIGKIHDRYCLVCANDGTVKGGTYFPITVKKQLHATELAKKCGLPIVLFVDSGGGFLPLQSELFPDKNDGGRMFYLEAVYGSEGLPSVAVICGSCTAGGAYGPSMCEESAIVTGIGTLFLGGPPLVKAALGENISAEELGGAALHCGVSGVTDYMACTEEESFSIVRDSIATTNFSTQSSASQRNIQQPLYSQDTLDGLSGLDSIDKAGMLGIITRVMDGSRFREFKQQYGDNLIVGYGSIAGQMVGVAANCGPLSYEDGLKGAHLVQICQHRELPLIFLQNSGKMELMATESSDSSNERKKFTTPECATGEAEAAHLRGRAAMAVSVACLTTPKIVVNVAGCAGDDNHTMCGPGFDPTFSLSWPSGFLDYTNINNGAEPRPKTSVNKRSKFNFESGTCWHSASLLLTDAIIAPRDTRQMLVRCLDISAQKSKLRYQAQPGPVYRL